MDDGPTDAHYDFAAKVCGFDPREANQSDNPGPEQSSQMGEANASGEAGTSAMTSDGAGYSAAGNDDR